MESLLAYWGKILSVISDRLRLLILVVLFDSDVTGDVGASSVSFSELLKIAGIPRNLLAYHLKILRETNLVKRKYGDRGPYELTGEGNDILQTLGITEELLRSYKNTK